MALIDAESLSLAFLIHIKYCLKIYKILLILCFSLEKKFKYFVLKIFKMINYDYGACNQWNYYHLLILCIMTFIV